MASFADRFGALGIDPFTAWMLQNQHSLSDTTPLPMIPTEGQSQAMMPFDPPRRMLAGAGEPPVIDATDMVFNAGPGGLGLGAPWEPTNPAIQADNGLDAINRALALRRGGGMPGGALAYDASSPALPQATPGSTPAPPIMVPPNPAALPQRAPAQDAPQATSQSAYTSPQQGGLPMLPGHGGDPLQNLWPVLMAMGGMAGGSLGDAFKSAANVSVVQNKLGTTDDIKEFQYAVSQGYKGTFQDWQTIKRSLSGEFAKQIIFGTDAQGNPVALQPNNRGEIAASKLPPGISLAAKPQMIDLGTHEAVFDPTTRQILQMIPKNKFAAGAQAAEGKGVGEVNAEQWKTLTQQGDKAVQSNSSLARLREISEQAYEGRLAGGLQAIRGSLATFGIDPGKVPAGEELEAITNKLVLDAAGGSLGVGFSNADTQFIKNINPGLTQTHPGRMRIADMLQKINDRKIEMMQLASTYRQQNNGSMDGFQVVAARYAKENPLFGPAPATPGGGGTGAPNLRKKYNLE